MFCVCVCVPDILLSTPYSGVENSLGGEHFCAPIKRYIFFGHGDRGVQLVGVCKWPRWPEVELVGRVCGLIKGGLVRLFESAFTGSTMLNTSSRVEKCTREAFMMP